MTKSILGMGLLLLTAVLIGSPSASAMTPICGRTYGIVEYLELIFDKPCNQITDAEIGGVQYLSLSKLNGLKPGDFDGFTSVSNMTLSGSNLTDVPASAFSGLVSLRKMYFSSITFNKIPDAPFAELPLLNEMIIYDLEVPDLPDNFFQGTDLRVLIFDSDQGVPRLPADLFQHSPRLRRVDLGNSGYKTLPAGLFRNLIYLQRLALTNIEMDEESARAIFEPLVGLSKVWLNYGGTWHIPDGIFNQHPHLSHIYYDGTIPQLAALEKSYQGKIAFIQGDPPQW
jgi:Leucine-rich repeat (LRR) protein